MRVLVTGATGYIGSCLAPLLASKHEVVALCRQTLGPLDEKGPGLTVQVGDLRDRLSVRTALRGIDAVVHLAGMKGASPCSTDPWGAVQSNLIATETLLEESREAGVQRFIFASSYYAYGRHAGSEMPCTETSELRPLDVYGITKVLAEELVRQSGLDYLILRLSNIFGLSRGGDSREVVFSMVECAFQRSSIEVHGDGTQTLDLIPLSEVCEVILTLVENPHAMNSVVNVASGRAVSLMELAQIIAAAFDDLHLGKVAINSSQARGGGIPCSREVSVSRLHALAGSWRPVPLPEAISAFIRQYREGFA